MSQDRIVLIATLIVAVTGVLWGVYWLPVRAMVARGLPGAWGTVLATSVACLALSPFVLWRWRDVLRAGPVALGSIALGGAAFTLYSIGLVYGRVAIIILLYFLTPVWSTLIGRYVMGWHTPALRVVAIGLGILGLVVMLSAGGEAPLPRGAGEWMALIAGVMWALGTTGIRARSTLGPGPATCVFAAGATVTGLVLAPFFDPWPAGLSLWGDAGLIGLGLVTGIVWWGLSLAMLMWATLRLDPARVGILMQTEVLVGALSAALLAGEHLHPLEIAGGALVVAAGLLEVWPVRRRARAL
ncbi:DMT family transporter [Salipiger abyssi]|uniref:EamA-like transporter family protein n=1 Tax=Salipiger abyssi TaxID=1250539 RepID=A0A1P8UYY4_9RHOB|nr:DMT family transporter [Salipiger abyssi]APZ54603.1 EamA-like transporter family protein [Salipiger abyssi]